MSALEARARECLAQVRTVLRVGAPEAYNFLRSVLMQKLITPSQIGMSEAERAAFME